MFFFREISFDYPYLLFFALFLPFIWNFLKTSPPLPNLKKFPAIVFLAKKKSLDQTPKKISYPIVILRFMILIFLIVGFSQPQINRANNNQIQNLIILDNSWLSGTSWIDRKQKIVELIRSQESELNNFSIITTTEFSEGNFFNLNNKKPSEIIEFISSLEPLSWEPNYSLLHEQLKENKKIYDNIYWFTEPLIDKDKDILHSYLSKKNLKIIKSSETKILPIVKFSQKKNNTYEFVISHPLNVFSKGVIDSFDKEKKLLYRVSYEEKSIKKNGMFFTKILINIPISISNKINYFQLNKINSSATKMYLSKIQTKKTLGIVSINQNEKSLKFNSGNYFVDKALGNKFETKKNSLENLINMKLKLLFIDDLLLINKKIDSKIISWVKKGGTLIKFGGTNMINSILDESESSFKNNFSLTGRIISVDSQLSLKKSLKISNISVNSPLYGLQVPDEVRVKQYIESQPSITSKKINVWLSLENGTPLISSISLQKGKIIFFHIPSNATWSNLPLSYFFLEIIERIVNQTQGDKLKKDKILKPFLNLNAMGELIKPSAQSLNIDKKIEKDSIKVNYNYPPGLYKDNENFYALNQSDNLLYTFRINKDFDNQNFQEITSNRTLNFGPFFLISAFFLFFLDTLVTLFLRQLLKIEKTKFFLVTVVLIFYSSNPYSKSFDIEKVMSNKIGYIVTGDDKVDKVTHNGLKVLSKFISNKTAAIFSEPTPIDLKEDKLLYYPIIYWTTDSDQKVLPKKIRRFLNDGGLLLIDCKLDELNFMINKCLDSFQKLLKNNQIGQFKEIDEKHAMSKSFYIINNFPGRKNNPIYFATTELGDFDNTASVIIGNNDWVGAWAKNENNEFLFSLLQNDLKQRNVSFKFGVNLLIYSLTGNYKTDQVHIPEFLKRIEK